LIDVIGSIDPINDHRVAAGCWRAHLDLHPASGHDETGLRPTLAASDCEVPDGFYRFHAQSRHFFWRRQRWPSPVCWQLGREQVEIDLSDDLDLEWLFRPLDGHPCHLGPETLQT